MSDLPPSEGRVVRSLRRPEAFVRFGPFAVSSANVAVTGSILLHVLIGVALVTGRVETKPPVMDMAEGEEAADVSIQFLSPEQLQELLDPKTVELARTQPVRVPEVDVEPPTPEPAQMPATAVETKVVELQPVEVAMAPAVPITRPANEPLQDAVPPAEPVESEPVEIEPAPAPAPPPPPASVDSTQKPAGVDREPREVDLPRPKYPTLSRRLGEEGEVVLSAVIGVDGKARDIRVERSPGHRRLVDAAIAALESARFEPGERNGRPAPVRVSVPFRFRLTR